jgi:HEAT repeat protein
MKKIACFAIALAVAAGSAEAQRARSGRAAGVLVRQAEDPADSLYRIAHQALTDGDYRRAATLFGQVADKYPKSAKAGDALYWRAWSLNKYGAEQRDKSSLAQALDAVDRQTKEYPGSVVGTDSQVLRGQIRTAQANLGDADAAGDVAASSRGLTQSRGCSGNKADEEMRLAALDGLISMNADDAVPILKEVLKQRDACRVEMRKKAVFLLSQKKPADAAQTLLDVARNDPDLDVRRDAVQWLAQTGSEAAVPLLDSILFSSRNDELQDQAIFALSQVARRSDRARQSLRRAAEDETLSRDVRASALHWLGQNHLVDLAYFKELFRKTKDGDLRGQILFAVQQSQGPEATAWLQELARDKTVDVETRKNAIFHLGQRKSTDMNTLASIYDSAKGEDEIQDQVIFVYSLRREPEAVDKLLAIAKTDPNIERRKQALFWLGKKSDPRVNQLLRDLIIKPDSLTKQ